MAGGKRYPFPACRHKIMGYLSHVGAACCEVSRPYFFAVRHPLHPRRHSRLFRAVHHLRGFRQLRRGAAGDRVPHQPLRTAHAGDVAVSKAPRPALRDSGQDLRVASFLKMRKTF